VIRRAVADKLGNAPDLYPHLTRLGLPRWGSVPGRPMPQIYNTATDGMPWFAVSPEQNGATYWAPDTFHPDQYAEVCHGPPAWDYLRKCVGAVVRQDPGSDTCYVAYPIYEGDETGGGVFWFVLDRVRNGVVTEITRQWFAPAFMYADDWWFLGLEVWGQNPVRLRVISKAPSQFVIGSGDGSGQLPDHGCRYVIGGVEQSHGTGYMFTPTPAPLGGLTAPPTDGAVAWNAANAASNPGRAWILWEGVDSSADRILSGQPGFRWGGFGYFNGYSAAHWTAQELRLTARSGDVTGGSLVLSGERQPNATIQIAGGTVGSVSYPTASTWQATASGVSAGASFTVTAKDDGGVTLEAVALGAVSISAGAVEDGAVAVSGGRPVDVAITVTCATGTVGAVSYPTATTWEATVSGLSPGTNIVTATDGTASDSVEVAGVVQADAPADATLGITQDAGYAAPGGGNGTVAAPAVLGAQQDAAYGAPSLEGAEAEVVELGAHADAESMPPLPVGWLARFARSGWSWVAGPYMRASAAQEAALEAAAQIGDVVEAIFYEPEAAGDHSAAVGLGAAQDAAYAPYDRIVFGRLVAVRVPPVLKAVRDDVLTATRADRLVARRAA
jgi:hypothetical protein